MWLICYWFQPQDQSRSKKVDSVELPPKMKAEVKAEVKQESKTVTNGATASKVSEYVYAATSPK